MNRTLLQNRPKELSEEKFKEMWENSAYTLEALFKTIESMQPEDKITPESFDQPAFVHKLVWVQAQRDFAKKVLDLFPKSLTTK